MRHDEGGGFEQPADSGTPPLCARTTVGVSHNTSPTTNALMEPTNNLEDECRANMLASWSGKLGSVIRCGSLLHVLQAAPVAIPGTRAAQRSIIATVTVTAEVILRMDDVPLTFIRYGIGLGVAGETRRGRRI